MKKTTLTLTEKELTIIINALSFKSDRIGNPEKIEELDNIEEFLRAVRTELRQED